VQNLNIKMRKIKSFKLFENVSNIPTEDEVKYSLIDLYDLGYDIDISFVETNICIEIYKNSTTQVEYPDFKVFDIVDCIITIIDFFNLKYDGFSYNLLYFKRANPNENGRYINIEGDLDLFFENNKDLTTTGVLLYLNF